MEPFPRAGRPTTMRLTTVRAVPCLVVALLVLGGCATGGDHDAAGGTGSAPDTEGSVGPTPTPSPSPSRGSTTPPSEAMEKIRVVGVVVSTGDCVVLRDDNGITWTVTGSGTAQLEAGVRVRVTGTPDLRAEGCGGPLVRAAAIAVE